MPLLKVVLCLTINSFFPLLNCLFGFLSSARRSSVNLCYGSSSGIFLVPKLEKTKVVSSCVIPGAGLFLNAFIAGYTFVRS
uniref:Uncharacterized protein n=1 Tax=Ixodes ricinus TaxID=34613 RepID=A0A6B0U6I2_IXORI